MQAKKAGISSVSPGGVKRDARRDKKSGERPNTAMLVPDAMPMYWGNVLVAAKTSEK